jgi:hypothetical protein
LLAGVNDAPEHKQATLLVFDHRRIQAQPAIPTAQSISWHAARNGAEGYLLPRTEIGIPEEFNRVVELRVAPGRITAIVSDGISELRSNSVIYEFDYSFRVLQCGALGWDSQSIQARSGPFRTPERSGRVLMPRPAKSMFCWRRLKYSS